MRIARRLARAIPAVPALALAACGVGCFGSSFCCGDTFDRSDARAPSEDADTPPPVCGNGLRETGEACDGSDFGGADCASLAQGFVDGPLSCVVGTCELDTSGCRGPGPYPFPSHDFNGDSYADFVVGAPGGPEDGTATVYFGTPEPGVLATAAGTLASMGWPSTFGVTVAAAGDVNGDGFGDVLVGAPSVTSVDSLAGRAYLYYGGAGDAFDPTPDASRDGVGQDDFYGQIVAGGEDLNGDNYADVAVGNWGVGGGRVEILFGGPGAFDTTPDGVLQDDCPVEFGWVAVVHDLNGDGFGDVVVGNPTLGYGTSSLGQACVYFGAPGDTFDTTLDGLLTGPDGVGAFAARVATAGDVDRDGFGDLVLGAPYGSRAYLFLGGAGTTFDSAADATFVHEDIADFASMVGSARDLDGDGFGDLVIGTPQAEPPEIRLYFGGAGSGLDSEEDLVVTNGVVGSFFGAAFSSPGDLDGDGLSDLLVGARYEAPAGKVYIYRGRPRALLTAIPDAVIDGPAGAGSFGFSVD